MEKSQLKTRMWFKKIGDVAGESVKRLSHEEWFQIGAEVSPSQIGTIFLTCSSHVFVLFVVYVFD
jgi:hypothetical protein